MKVLIIGGVAGGASAAARLRRLNEKAEIIMFERGEHISFANCGLPYYIGGTIKERQKLLVQTPTGMGKRFKIDVRTKHEVIKINRNSKQVLVKNHQTGEEYLESYDYVILSPGAEPVVPPISGLVHNRVFSLRSLDDTDRIKDYLSKEGVNKAVIIGGGFIGLEMAENLQCLGMQVSVVEAQNQVMASLDREMAELVHRHIRQKDMNLVLSDGVKEVIHEDGESRVVLLSGQSISTQAVILAIGVKPESKLAGDAGLELGERGAIKVSEYLQSSDPYIYAVGDAIEVEEFINKVPTYIPLAGPANRQGRIAANNVAGATEKYRGTQGTSITKVFDLTVATTGVNEKVLQKMGKEYYKSYTTAASHAGYYPGAIPITIKLIFDKNGKIFGAQLVGVKGVDKRIDVLATAVRAGLTVFDLQELELAYAPPYSTAKDPVNMAGFVAANILKGDVEVIHWDELGSIAQGDSLLIDVRTPVEFSGGYIEGAINMPLDELRERLTEIPAGKDIIVSCQSGLRSYVAARILSQAGFKVKSLSGGWHIYSLTKNFTN